MKDIRLFIRSTLIYLVGNVFAKALSFLLLPIYTKYLTPGAYGLYDLSNTYNTFIQSILFLDIFAGIMRFMFDYKKEERDKPIVNGLAIFALSAGVYAIVMLIAQVSGIHAFHYAWLLYFVGIASVFQQIVGYIARADGKNRYFVYGGIIGAVFNFVTSLLFYVYLHLGYQYIFVSTLIGLVINAWYVARKIHFRSRLHKELFDRPLFKAMLAYSLPLSVNSAAFWFLTGFNRVAISNVLSVTQNGLFAVASKFTSIIQLVTTCFQLAWQELSFSKAGESKQEMSVFYSKATNAYIVFLMWGLIFATPAVKIIFPYFIGAQYASAEAIVPLAMFAAVASSVSSFLGSIINTIKQNKYIFTTTILAAVVNVAIVLALLKVVGIQAANISLAAGFTVNCIRRVQLINRTFKLSVNLYQLLFPLVVFAIVYVVYVLTGAWVNLLMIVVVAVVLFARYHRQIVPMIRSFLHR